jgi:hypothetical protein
LRNETFTNFGTAIFATGVAVGDYNNDGFLDVLSLTTDYYTPTAQIWRNLGNGTFVNTATVPGGNSGSLTWFDFNGDSQLDFLVTGQQGVDSNANPAYVSQVYQNVSGSPTNSPPTAPTNLTFQTFANGGVKMMWGSATDDHTPVAGLNYNIRVGSASGAVDIVSPEADPITGRRYVVQLGNAYERQFSLLTNLTGGTYYWSVQAIDTAFAGGAFATESTFTIAPRISSFSYQTNGQFQVTFNALPANSYTLQASTDFTTWTNLANVIPATNGPAQLIDTNINPYPMRYYRVKCP